MNKDFSSKNREGERVGWSVGEEGFSLKNRERVRTSVGGRGFFFEK